MCTQKIDQNIFFLKNVSQEGPQILLKFHENDIHQRLFTKRARWNPENASWQGLGAKTERWLQITLDYSRSPQGPSFQAFTTFVPHFVLGHITLHYITLHYITCKGESRERRSKCGREGGDMICKGAATAECCRRRGNDSGVSACVRRLCVRVCVRAADGLC